MEDAEFRNHFHRAIDTIATPPPWLEDRVRLEVQRKQGQAVHRHRVWHLPSVSPRFRHVLATALVIIVGLSAIGASLAIYRYVHGPVPVQPVPAPHRQLIPCTGSCDVSPQRAAAPVARQCPASSYTIAPNTPTFVTPMLGWIAGWNWTPGNVMYACLYRTDDGGATWRSVLSWDGDDGSQLIRSSADGVEVLVVTRTSEPATLFHTADAGLHWTSKGFPNGADSSSKVFFASPHEGWVLSAAKDLFHTTDAGAHWRLIGRLQATGVYQNGLYFLSSNVGWYLPVSMAPATSPTAYMTRDGGMTWSRSVLSAPAALSSGMAVAETQVKFFNSNDGVLDATYCSSLSAETGGLVYSCSSGMSDYVYVTKDGGDHWSTPVHQPGMRNVYADARHWIGVTLQGFCSTPPCPIRLIDIQVQGLLATGDAGNHWAPLTAKRNCCAGQLDGIDFIDSSDGWVVLNGNLLVTNDGGTSWFSRTLPGVWF